MGLAPWAALNCPGLLDSNLKPERARIGVSQHGLYKWFKAYQGPPSNVERSLRRPRNLGARCDWTGLRQRRRASSEFQAKAFDTVRQSLTTVTVAHLSAPHTDIAWRAAPICRFGRSSEPSMCECASEEPWAALCRYGPRYRGRRATHFHSWPRSPIDNRVGVIDREGFFTQRRGTQPAS